MPELREPQQPQFVDPERKPYISAEKELDDDLAVTLVTETFKVYEQWRKNNQDKRWESNEALYFGLMPKRVWKGTDVERASLPVPIIYDQVETAYPIIMDSLFAYYPRFFEVSPVGDTHPRDAAAVKDALAAKFDTPIDDDGLKAEAHFGIALKQCELLGDGAVEVSWDRERSMPVVEWVDLRDLYMDPNTPTPQIDKSPAVIRRKMMTVEDLRNLRGSDPNIRIPDDAILNTLAKTRFDTASEQGKKTQASLRGQSIDTTLRTDPRYQTVEVLMYWTVDKLIWVLGRKWAAINTKNPYEGMIPFAKAPFTLVPGQPYSMGLADVLEGDQKYAQGIRNTRLDNLALAMNPPRHRVAGAQVAPSATAWRPGLEDKVASIDQIEVVKIENVTADSFREEQLIHAQASKRTGVNDFAQSGVPMPSNANRSASGVMQQVRTISQRLSAAVKNYEDFIIIPVLYKFLKLMTLYSPETFQVPGPQGPVPIARESLKRPVKFSMRAASRMVVRDRLMMMLAPITQIVFNEAVMKQANMQGKTLDFHEFERFLQDASNTTESYKFFRSMQPDEMKRMQQPDAKTMMDWQKAQLEAQTRTTMGKMKAQTEMAKVKSDAAVKLSETGEKSARELVKLLAAGKTPETNESNE